MAEQKNKKQTKKEQNKKSDQKKSEKEHKERKIDKHQDKEILEESLIRISGYDVPGSKKIYAGLTRIKGVSWSISNAVCVKLGFDKAVKISDLSKDDILKVENFLKNPEINDFLKNRRYDEDTGEIKHIIGSELDMRKDFDIRKMKKIKSYKGIRHIMNQPVRGQRTRAHFRKTGKAVGVKKTKK